uniref:Uncharacterized protein n=1 Tax=Trichobilharzia regenti TaxID=157069 RepID=A0AA85IVS5_TRIRE|nr:unnamed protein product [Trichobilharzia regenti]
MKFNLISATYLFTLFFIIATHLEAMKMNTDSLDESSFNKRAYHFFRLKRSPKCFGIPDEIKQMITRDPYIICQEDRDFLGL